MIGKAEWFTYRVLGWGIGPKTKEAWYYMGIAIAIAAGITFLPVAAATKAWMLGAYVTLFVLDVLHIMTLLPAHHDERENLHQLIIERNCSFAAVVGLVAVAGYQTYHGGNAAIDLGLFVILGVMLATKIGSYLYVKSAM